MLLIDKKETLGLSLVVIFSSKQCLTCLLQRSGSFQNYTSLYAGFYRSVRTIYSSSRGLVLIKTSIYHDYNMKF